MSSQNLFLFSCFSRFAPIADIRWHKEVITYPDGHTEILFTPPAPYETPEALDKICEEYNRVIGNPEVEPLIVIAVFIHDFLCIHPFNDGNGRMSRLLTNLLYPTRVIALIPHIVPLNSPRF